MDFSQSSQEWTQTHFAVNDLLSELLNELRNSGYNPSFHVSYDHAQQHIVVDQEIISKHAQVAKVYRAYVDACEKRHEAVEKIQGLEKVDLGF